MKKTYRKLVLRTMQGTASRFIAIAAIVALGVGLLSGLMAMPINMRTTIDNYFDRQNMHDLRIVGTLGLTQADVDAIAAVPGVDEVMPAYQTDVFMDAGEKKSVVTRIQSLPTDEIEERDPENYINRLDVVEGRLPVQAGECVLVESSSLLNNDAYAVGNTLTLSDTNGDVSDTLRQTEFKIVGIVRTSYYFSVNRENATIGDGTVALKMYICEEDFSAEVYSEIFVTVDGAKALNCASDEYQEAVDAVARRIEDISGARCEIRYEEVKTQMEDALADARTQLEDAQAEADAQLGDAADQLDDARAQLDASQAQLDSAQSQIASGEKELEANRETLPDTLQQKQEELATGQAALIDAKEQYEAGKAQLETQRQTLEDARTQLESSKKLVETLEPVVTQAAARLPALKTQADSLQTTADAAQAAYDSAAAVSNVSALKATYEEKQAAADAAQATLTEKQQAVDAAQAALDADPGNAALQAALTAATTARDTAQAAATAADAAAQTAQQAYLAEQSRLTALSATAQTAQAQADAAKQTYDSAAQTLASSQQQLDSAKAQIAESEPLITQGEAQLAAAEAQLESAHAQIIAAEKQIASGQTALSIAPGLAQLQLDLAQAQLDAAKTQYADGVTQLQEGEEQYAEGEAEYQQQKQDVEQQLADARAQLEDGEQQLADLAVPEWYVLDRNSHVSAASYLSNVDKLEAITTVFPLFFFLVAALVALTTMTRLVEEERLQIGTLKALGYPRRQIMFKYLLYAWLATLVGGLLGLAFGFTVLPLVIWNAYTTMYTIPDFHCLFHTGIAVVGVGAALVCTSLATMNACSQTLKENAAQLLLPKAPAAGKRILLERITPLWRRMKFTYKVTARNLFRYKKRFFMTIIGVAGCTALLVTGFGLKDSISDIISKQFGEIFTYDFIVTLSKDSVLESDEWLALMDDTQQVARWMPVRQERIAVETGELSQDAYVMVPESAAQMKAYIDLHDRKTGSAVALTDAGVVVSEKFCEQAGLAVGDTVTLDNGSGLTHTFPITGIAENYVENYIYMTPTAYQEAYGIAPVFDAVLAMLPTGVDEMPETLSTALLELDGVSGLNQISVTRTSLDDTLTSINSVVYVIILCAAMLAFVVLYNLTNINIAERSKEIATIKVLGFFEPEVAAYIFRESNVLTVIGMLAGLVAGVFLHMFIMRTVEVDLVMFGRSIKPLSFVLAAVFTIAFSQLVNLVMRRKLRHISMVESMKAPE